MMIRFSIRAAALSVVLATWTLTSAQAQENTTGRARIRSTGYARVRSTAGSVRIRSAQSDRGRSRIVVRGQSPMPGSRVFHVTPGGMGVPHHDGMVVHSGGPVTSGPCPGCPQIQRMPTTIPVPQTAMQPYPYMQGHLMPRPYMAANVPFPMGGLRPDYPYLNAPLYTCPRQNIPHQTGSTIITNQAFAPHEMLWAHEYKALYPPFYYKVKGHWWTWPWGIESHDKWKLQGTEVSVKYKSRISLFSGFTPPVLP